MTNAWSDFNDAAQNANLIPKGTIARVRLTIRPGGFDDPSQGWTGGYAKRGTTGSVYLDAEYTVLEGPYAKRKIWSMIGLYSPNGPNWANMGRKPRPRHSQLCPWAVRQGPFAGRAEMRAASPGSPISMGSSSWRALMSAPTPMATRRTISAPR